MRNLLFVCVLAGVSVACRDALSPRDAAGAALSEASQRAHLDLREERASLIAAGNAVSAAIQQQGVAAALGDAFAEDVVFLGARTNTIQGRAGAVDWLTSNPLAPSAIAWSVLVAGRLQRRHPGIYLDHGHLHRRLRHRADRVPRRLSALLAAGRR